MIENERLTGRDLIVLRTSHGIRQSDIARAWPCSRGNVARIERSLRPTPMAVEKFMAALRVAEAER